LEFIIEILLKDHSLSYECQILSAVKSVNDTLISEFDGSGINYYKMFSNPINDEYENVRSMEDYDLEMFYEQTVINGYVQGKELEELYQEYYDVIEEEFGKYIHDDLPYN